MGPLHSYAVRVRWTGNRGEGTAAARGYGREHIVEADGKPALAGSADPAFRGDRERWNPEDLLVAALSACHMLSYLYVCARNGIVVTAYEDDASGTMREEGNGGGRMTAVTLRPRVTIASGDPDVAQRLHHEAHELCFIANSVNFPVTHEPTLSRASAAAT